MTQAATADAARGPGITVPPPLIYLAGFMLGACGERIARSPAPPTKLRVGAALCGVASLLALDTNAMTRFSREGTPFNPARPAETLVTDGPYQLTRNPMYLGMAGAYAGVAVGARVLWALALLPVVLTVIDRAIVPREERHLAARFGEDYERYRQQVPRWL